jgi:hypothetical protein
MRDALSIQWHPTPEAVLRLMWAESFAAEGLSAEDMADAAFVCDTEGGESIEASEAQVLEGMRAQGCWGFSDTAARVIHAWAAPSADPVLVLHMLAHEVGHLTGEPAADDMAEELRAEVFGGVAAQAFRLLLQRPTAGCCCTCSTCSFRQHLQEPAD